MNGETGSYVERDRPLRPSGAAVPVRHLGRESSMRTVLCSTTAGRGVLLLALVAGGVGGSLALPASAADRGDTLSVGGGPHARHADRHRSHTSAVRVGPAVKYVRTADGSVRVVR